MLSRARARTRTLRRLELLLGQGSKSWGRAVETMPAAEKKKLVDTDGELGLTIDPSLLRGATADLLIKNRSEIFSSNVLSQKDLAQLHESTAIVSFLHARRRVLRHRRDPATHPSPSHRTSSRTPGGPRASTSGRRCCST